jgi:acyl-CoA synthetase (AMP-forming)/AMP-acid ligase II
MRLPLLLDMAADGLGDRVLVGRREDGLSAVALRACAQAGAAQLRDAGAPALVYLGANGTAFPVALFAAALVGVPLVPLNYRLGKEQLDGLLARHPGAFALADEGDATAAVERHGLSCRTPQAWLQALVGREVDAPTDVDEDAPAVVIYTSGTTSAPKGVLLRHANLVSYVLDTVEFAGAEQDDAALVSVPPYHVAGVANVITNVYAGRRTLALEQFTPREWMAVVDQERISNALLVPTMLTRVLDARTDEQLPTLRALAYGGAPMPRRTIERALRAWPHVEFVNAYGLTETSSTISVLGPEDHRAALTSEDPQVQARLGSAGRVLPSVELEVRDVNDAPVGPGVVGRLWVRGPQVSAEYAGIGKALDERGFFDTRDEGYLDQDGYLFIGGRSDDTIIRGAENIAPAEIEDVLLRHPSVSDVVVVGVPDEEWGQRLEAAVVVAPGDPVTEEGLRAFVREHLRASKTPDRIEFWDELPRTETGKLIRRHVVDRLVVEA